MIEEDTNALRDILGVPDESASRVPLCDVLFIYGKLDGSGAFEGRDLGLREIIRDSGARKMIQLFKSKKAAARLVDDKGKELIAKGADLNEETLRSAPEKYWPEISIGDEMVEEETVP